MEGATNPPYSHSNSLLWGNRAPGGPPKETKAEERPGAHGVTTRQTAVP